MENIPRDVVNNVKFDGNEEKSLTQVINVGVANIRPE